MAAGALHPRLRVGDLLEASSYQTAVIWGWSALMRPMTIVLALALVAWVAYLIRRKQQRAASVDHPDKSGAILPIAIFALAALAELHGKPQDRIPVFAICAAGLVLSAITLVRPRPAADRRPNDSTLRYGWLVGGFLVANPIIGLTASSGIFLAPDAARAAHPVVPITLAVLRFLGLQLLLLSVVFDIGIERDILGPWPVVAARPLGWFQQRQDPVPRSALFDRFLQRRDLQPSRFEQAQERLERFVFRLVVRALGRRHQPVREHDRTAAAHPSPQRGQLARWTVAAEAQQAVHDDRIRLESAVRAPMSSGLVAISRPCCRANASHRASGVRQRSRTVYRAGPRSETASAAIASRLVSALPTITRWSGLRRENGSPPSPVATAPSRPRSSASGEVNRRLRPVQMIAAAAGAMGRRQGLGQPQIGFQVLLKTPGLMRSRSMAAMMPLRLDSCQALTT